MKTRSMVRAWHAALISIPLVLTACGGDDDEPLLRKTSLGEVRGAADSTTGTLSWKGIPFAKPPVGALRWQPPQDAEAWTTARSATSFGNACVQYGRIYGPGSNNKYDATIGTTLNQAVGSEDCLYLNVWRPATGEGNLPVIVFFHAAQDR
jgi:para-nitrobenzyl esterase